MFIYLSKQRSENMTIKYLSIKANPYIILMELPKSARFGLCIARRCSSPSTRFCRWGKERAWGRTSSCANLVSERRYWSTFICCAMIILGESLKCWQELKTIHSNGLDFCAIDMKPSSSSPHPGKRSEPRYTSPQETVQRVYHDLACPFILSSERCLPER